MNSTKSPVKILFLADTHIGFDLPVKPRVPRRRRGEDFARNYERSEIPYPLLAMRSGVHIFRQPQTISIQVREHVVALSGFPYARGSIRQNFQALVEETGYTDVHSDLQLLLIHQAVDGAMVGPVDYMFKNAPDVVCSRDIPDRFAAALSGHIHRAQIIDKDLNGTSLKTPIIYPGSIERTSFAEKGEPKGYFILEFPFKEPVNEHPLKTSFVELPARPMVELQLELGGKTITQIEEEISHELLELAPDSIVRFKIIDSGHGTKSPITASRLRALAPTNMNVEMSYMKP